MAISYRSTSKKVKLDHGQVHYHEVGQGPNLLLLHGSGPGVTGWANFQGNLDFFSKDFRCIVMDLPGYGESDSITGDPILGVVDVISDFLKALDIKRTHIVGNSYGGILASFIAAEQHSLVTSFTTIGGIGLNLFTPFPGEGLNLLTAFAEDPTKERIEEWLRSMVYDQSLITDELIESRFSQAIEPATLESTRKIYARGAIQAIAQFRQGKYATKTIEHLSSIQAPTLITWGRDDRVSPLDVSLIPMRLIPNAELHVFPKCGHWAMIERKEEFEALVGAFLHLHEKANT